jgi:hypothetical protein
LFDDSSALSQRPLQMIKMGGPVTNVMKRVEREYYVSAEQEVAQWV